MGEMKDDSIENKNVERFVRWQKVLREHVTFTNNLIFTVSIGTLGYLISILGNKEFYPCFASKLFFTYGFILFPISIFFGLGAIFCRLNDFRATVEKIKLDSNQSDLLGSIELKRLMDIYGRVTWILLYGQLITFIIAEALIFMAFIFIYSDKLF